jgi:hypothetical protein
MEEFQSTEVLITVMTYPHPSVKSDEVVCTGGITRSGEWVRLYPINYRYRPREQQFHKYQWIRVELGPRGAGNDNRRESRKPRLETLRILGQPLSANDGWLARRMVIDPLPHHTLHELQDLFERDRTSLGIVRPSRVLDVKVEAAERDWKPEWAELYDQMLLFGEQPKKLAKLPFKWSYVFECPDSTKPHNAMIEDWELGVLFLKLRDEHDEATAAQKVREKYLDDLCAPDRDTRFFMGTVFPYNTWVVVGVFWPPRVYQGGLNLG